jgi:hypothetical protein
METMRKVEECSMEPAGAGIGNNSSPEDDRKANPRGYDHERGLARSLDIPPEGQMEETAHPSPQERATAGAVQPWVHRQSSL